MGCQRDKSISTRSAGCGAPISALAGARWLGPIADQAERLAFSNTFVDMTNDPSARLAAKLAELARAI